jgi:hypothetical protein
MVRITNGDDRVLQKVSGLGRRLPVQVTGAFNISSAPTGSMSVTRTRMHRHPILRNLNQKGVEDPENIVYARDPHPFQTHLKVLVSNGAYLYPTIDRRLGTSQNVYYILRDSVADAEATVRFLNSATVREIVESMKVGRYGSDYRDLMLLPDPVSLGLRGAFSEADVQKALGLRLTRRQTRRAERGI